MTKMLSFPRELGLKRPYLIIKIKSHPQNTSFWPGNCLSKFGRRVPGQGLVFRLRPHICQDGTKMKHSTILQALLISLTCALPSLLLAGPSLIPIKIEVWTRSPGQHAFNENPERSKAISLSIDQIVKAKLFDVQYQKENEYQGNFLHEIVEKYQPASPSDTIILHFDNKMIIPLPLSIVQSGAFEIFVASGIKERSNFSKDFPKIVKPSDRLRDPRPLVFSGNKLVVSKAWHPGFSKLIPKGFVPWILAGTLVGIEWIDSAAYRAQFSFGSTSEIAHGLDVYMERCVFCHAVRQVGGRYGWDFVDPLPIYTKRTQATLHAHVAYPKMDALERGLMMPAQPDFTEAEAVALWSWMRAAALNHNKRYK